ncbi:site-specific DNA-methyltransferase [Staphylococcus saprophyticus]|nr:site-specific DNA-methyltransferase [Staphylococcus saprophyticus]
MFNKDMKSNEFTERPRENDRESALKYISALIEEKSLHANDKIDDEINNLKNIQKLLRQKKYGLVWEEHSETVEEEMKTKIPVFEEVKNRKINNDNLDQSYNFLLEGDNLHSLHLLEKTHREKIDAIYIDPPYNTGSKSWRYNNAFVDKNDTFKHSKWLSFMYARLKIAKKLLKKSGILVLTIDDYEVENITLLLNDLFGEENHLGTVVIKNNPQGRSSVTGFQVSHEYALFYGGPSAKIGRIKRNQSQKSRYKEEDEYGRFEWRNFRAQYSSESPTMVYPIFVKKDLSDFRIPNLQWNEENKEYDIYESPNDNEIVTWPKDADGRMRTWKWSIDTVKKVKETEMEVRRDRQKNPAVYFKGRMTEEDMLPFTFWEEPKYSASTFGANILSDIIGKGKFNYPKSLYAVEDSLRVATANKKDALILDFFAGSGTTGQAVLNLNKEDGGTRKFILATNNENNIAEEVTYNRLKNINEGVIGKVKTNEVIFKKNITLNKLRSFEKKPHELEKLFIEANNIKEEYIEKNPDKEELTTKVKFDDGIFQVIASYKSDYKFQPLPLNLKYFKTKFIPKDSEILERNLLDNVKTLIELEHLVDLYYSENTLITTSKEMQLLKLDNLQRVFMRGRVRRMMSEEQQNRYRECNIEIIDVPELYFAEELRDLI